MSWNRRRWQTPVLVQLADEVEPAVIVTVDEAMSLLLNHWPGPRSRTYWLATNACSKCIDGQVGPSSVRTALIEAAREAGLRVEA